MTFKQILKLNPFHRYQYVKYYTKCAAGYEEMLDGLYKDFGLALDDYIKALKDSNNPSLVEIYGDELIEESILHANARVENFSAFIDEVTKDIFEFQNKILVLKKSIAKDLAYKGIYTLTEANVEKVFG